MTPSRAGRTVLFVANGGLDVGGGHVLRSLTLARALATAGARPLFLASPEAAAIVESFGPDVEIAPTPSMAPEALTAAAAPLRFDALVADHYGLSRPEHLALARGRPVLVIDDLADRPLGADIVLDAGPARRTEDYAGLVKPDAQLLLGPSFAPVRPEFAALRPDALARRGREPVRRALVAMGLTDVGGVSARIVQALRRTGQPLQIDVAFGRSAPSLPDLTRLAASDPHLAVHVDSLEMAALTAKADIGLGAAGSTAWERCTLGLPAITVVLADNQRPAAAALASRSATIVLDAGAPRFERDLEAAIRRLLADADLRQQLSTASAQICDGRGAERTAGALLARIADATA